MLTSQANNRGSRPARVCARCYGAASHSLKGLAFNWLSRLGQGHPGTCALAVWAIQVTEALCGAWAIVSTITLKNALLKSLRGSASIVSATRFFGRLSSPL